MCCRPTTTAWAERQKRASQVMEPVHCHGSPGRQAFRFLNSMFVGIPLRSPVGSVARQCRCRSLRSGRLFVDSMRSTGPDDGRATRQSAWSRVKRDDHRPDQRYAHRSQVIGRADLGRSCGEPEAMRRRYQPAGSRCRPPHRRQRPPGHAGGVCTPSRDSGRSGCAAPDRSR